MCTKEDGMAANVLEQCMSDTTDVCLKGDKSKASKCKPPGNQKNKR